MKWQSVEIKTDTGIAQAIAPLVISASRATDIPAFHGKWFMQRLRTGYSKWINPFNSNQSMLVSFEKCKVIVFWTKNPSPFMQHIDELDRFGFQYYFQFTLNDYLAEKLEPRLPSLSQRIDSFQKLSEKIGKERVIWRFDPIILGGDLTVDTISARIDSIGKRLNAYTEKMVFSFVDMYKKTENKLKKINPAFRPPDLSEMEAIAQEISTLNMGWSNQLELATCAESINLSKFGIEKNKCVDNLLISRLCKNDNEILSFYDKTMKKEQQLSLLENYSEIGKKDTGQRTPCGCVPSKDIGAYNTCMHLCEYCYANSSQKVVIDNMNKISNYKPTLD